MHLSTALIATLAAIAAAQTPILPPNDPPYNGPNDVGCTTDDECLAGINSVRLEQEGLANITLPFDWTQESPEQQLFTIINLERTSRGLGALTQSDLYANEIETGILNRADPEANLAAIWAGAYPGGYPMITLAAMYLWMYYDGPGGYNTPCTDSGQLCWGHRNNILSSTVSNVDVGAGTDSTGSAGYDALFW